MKDEKFKRWSKYEDVILKEKYPNTDIDSLCKTFGRTKNSVTSRARYLGFLKTKEFISKLRVKAAKKYYVDLSYFKHDQHGKKYALLFHGNMNYLPNVDCALYIANEILPLLHKRNRNLTLLISGASPQKKVRQLSSRTGITVTGWLDDVRTAYAASQIFIAPLQMGTGIQNKILEAIAMQLPCVVSPLAADALMLQHGEHVLIGKTPDEYCDHIERLTADPQLRLYLTTKAYQYIQTQFIWEDSVYKLANFISSN